MNAARCLWSVGLIFALAPRLVAGQTAPVAPRPMPVTPTETTTTPASPWSWIKMPKITMPKIEMPKMPTDPFAPVKASARKVKDGTKRAWEGTKELFTFGGPATDEPTERVASKPESPSIWSRMFGRAEEEPEGPQTVADWMAQKRPE